MLPRLDNRQSIHQGGCTIFLDPETDAETTAHHAFSTAGGESLRNEALTRQLRNLLLLAPLFQLELGKGRLGIGDEALFEGIDTLYLCLSLFDFISERMVMDLGALRAEIVEHLVAEIGHSGRGLDREQAARAAEQVLDALGNARERHRAFSLTYFDARNGELRRREFRLIRHREESDGTTRYVLTPDGITAFLGLLDVDPSLAQQAEEILIQRLTARGRFRDALRLARRARTRTLELKESLRRRLFHARRAGGTMGWVEEALPQLNHAIDHIRGRQAEENAIVQAIAQHDLSRLEEAARADWVALRETVGDCQYQHAVLHHEVMTTNERFLEIQTGAFRAWERSALPNLESDVLEPLLGESMASLVEAAPAITATLNPALTRKLFDPLLLLDVIERIPEPGDTDRAEERDEALEALQTERERFPKVLVERVVDYLKGEVAARGTATLGGLLRQAELGGLDRDERLCLVYLVMAAFNPKDDRIGVTVDIAGRLVSELVSGTDLELRRKEA